MSINKLIVAAMACGYVVAGSAASAHFVGNGVAEDPAAPRHVSDRRDGMIIDIAKKKKMMMRKRATAKSKDAQPGPTGPGNK